MELLEYETKTLVHNILTKIFKKRIFLISKLNVKTIQESFLITDLLIFYYMLKYSNSNSHYQIFTYGRIWVIKNLMIFFLLKCN
jgi:hypothetical protein